MRMAAKRSVLYESWLVVMGMAVILSTGHTLGNSVSVAVCSIYILQGVSPSYTYDGTGELTGSFKARATRCKHNRI